MIDLRTQLMFGLAAALLAAATAYGHFGGGRQRFAPMAVATSGSFDGAWHFCRLAYRGLGWTTDYPDADHNFSARISELTKTGVNRTPGGEVRPLIVRPMDDALFQCLFSIDSYAVGINVLLYTMAH